ncbi:MAG: hypothetical protein R3D02_09635 [Hyphomicrobiales bacterium]
MICWAWCYPPADAGKRPGVSTSSATLVDLDLDHPLAVLADEVPRPGVAPDSGKVGS